ncbi:putative RING finger domain protein [Aspergillus vadensis CBS 113365]|uniref:RING finger domain protein n=1 Tax=Aspergillus vadensis (strain CBS 113365 / IMI 142717 / IBT 24658) TaxID=1448311 RepID=A0A319CSQ7_ASPVC|nr:RING finger domain protein [Aspergillus vadensis CBS 113365]PYH71292.1 RING finger domain protein [Aspergillus vadensis CBS 113365]
MAHSKRNTSLPHFTSYERDLLKSSWGTKRGVIGRDSFLPFGSCRLCLHPAREPVVACATNGDLFCRECAISDLLAQRQEIKRLEKERDEAKKRLAEEEERALDEARTRELRDFELVSMGLDAAAKKNNGSSQSQNDESSKKRKADTSEALAAFKAREVEVDGKRKKVFELDDKEMARIAREEQERLKNELKKKKEANKSALPSFWVPSLTPTTDPNEIAANKTIKLTPICPASTDSNRHSYSLKSLVEVHFTEEKTSDGSPARVCPSCKKTLTNGLKAMLTKPCGHVICQPCVNKFMTPHDAPDPHASKEEQEQTAALHGRILCYVCETDVTPSNDSNKDSASSGKKKKKDKEGIRPGLVEVSSEGTGFAGRGGNVATKSGVAFQC